MAALQAWSRATQGPFREEHRSARSPEMRSSAGPRRLQCRSANRKSESFSSAGNFHGRLILVGQGKMHKVTSLISSVREVQSEAFPDGADDPVGS